MSNPAPGELELIRSFVNTWDVEDGTDAIASADALRDWLVESALLEAGTKVTTADQRRAAGVREALRATLRAHHGGHEEQCVADALCEASERAKLQVLFDEHGNSRLVAGADGVDGALGKLLTIVHESDREGQWIRLKVCPADDCQWAFYDPSRNRSATWCSMKVCGNRHKVREFRERRQRGAAR